MAKIRTKSGKIVTGNILNESFDSYIVEYNGKIGRINKKRVIGLDSLDEGVLDTIKTKAKNLLKRIASKWVQVIFTGDELKAFVHSDDPEEDGKSDDALIPMGLAILANEAESVNGFNPCDATIDYARELGILGPGPKQLLAQKEAQIAESAVLKEANVQAPYMGVAKRDAQNSNRINLDAIGNYDPAANGDKAAGTEDQYVFDITYEDAVMRLVQQYKMQADYPNFKPRYALCILGAPGNAKSALVDSALDMVRKDLGYKDAESISIVLGGGAEGLLYMPTSVRTKFRSRSGELYDEDVWAQKPMQGIPAYQIIPGDKDKTEVYKERSNGLIVNDKNEVVKEAQGGFFIIDEFTRSDERSMKEIMNILSGNVFGNNLRMGNRWVCVVAGNRKKDMENLASSQDFALDSAQRTRLAIHNMVLSAQSWAEWASKPNKELDGVMPNVLPEIVAFIEAGKDNDNLYKVQISDTNPDEYVNVWQDAANARSWQGLSNELLAAMNYYDPTFTKVNTIRDLMNINPKYTQRWLEATAAAHVGKKPAEDFVKFLMTLDFDKKAAQEVFNTGTCQVKSATPSFMIPIVQRIANCNPVYLANPNAPAEQILPPQNLYNILDYLYKLCQTLGGRGSASSTAVTSLRRYFSVFDDYCAALYSGLGGKSILDNFTIDKGNGEYEAVPGYEKFVAAFYKYVSSYSDYVEARQKKGLA